MGSFGVLLGSNMSAVMADDDIMGGAGGGGWTNPIQGAVGAIRSFGMQVKPYNRKNASFQAGSKGTDSWHRVPEEINLNPYTQVYTNSLPVSMHGTLQTNPEHMGGHVRSENNRFLPNISGGYIDTGYIAYPASEYEYGDRETHLYRQTTGCYNNLLENFLVTRFDGLNISGGSEIKDLTPHALAKRHPPLEATGTST